MPSNGPLTPGLRQFLGPALHERHGGGPCLGAGHGRAFRTNRRRPTMLACGAARSSAGVEAPVPQPISSSRSTAPPSGSCIALSGQPQVLVVAGIRADQRIVGAGAGVEGLGNVGRVAISDLPMTGAGSPRIDQSATCDLQAAAIRHRRAPAELPRSSSPRCSRGSPSTA